MQPTEDQLIIAKLEAALSNMQRAKDRLHGAIARMDPMEESGAKSGKSLPLFTPLSQN